MKCYYVNDSIGLRNHIEYSRSNERVVVLKTADEAPTDCYLFFSKVSYCFSLLGQSELLLAGTCNHATKKFVKNIKPHGMHANTHNTHVPAQKEKRKKPVLRLSSA